MKPEVQILIDYVEGRLDVIEFRKEFFNNLSIRKILKSKFKIEYLKYYEYNLYDYFNREIDPIKNNWNNVYSRYVIWFSALCSFIAFLLVLQLKVPFRTPLDPKKFSTDRFWMKKAKPLFFTMLPTTFAMGLLLFMNLSITFFTMMMTGMLIALLLHELFFKGKDSLTEVLLGSTLLAIVFCGNLTEAFSIDHMLSGILAGAGISLITSRYLLYFIRVAEHCERGTGQSTYMLGWECGIYLGVMACSTLVLKYHKIADYLGLCSIIFSAVAYLRYTHQWFLKNCRKDIK